jgi:mono/diheme cytochrome c family protein
MATRTGFNWGAFIGGAVAIIVLAIVGAAVVAFGGLYPVAASNPHTAGVKWFLEETRDHAIERSASGLTAPNFSAADIRMGAGHFKGMCQACHGGPGVEPEEFAAGMNPRPPNLAKAAGDLSVSEVFWIEKNGLKMTGMPAFAKTDEDEELWKVAAFVKAMPNFSAADYASIPNAHEEEHEHGAMAGDKGAHSH